MMDVSHETKQKRRETNANGHRRRQSFARISHSHSSHCIGHDDDADADDADGCEDATDATSDGVRRRRGGAHGGVCVVWIIVVVVEEEEEEWTRTNG